MATKKPAKRKATSGTVWGDEHYQAAGYGRITLRIPQEELDKLAHVSTRWGIGRQDAVRHMIAHSSDIRPPAKAAAPAAKAAARKKARAKAS